MLLASWASMRNKHNSPLGFSGMSPEGRSHRRATAIAASQGLDRHIERSGAIQVGGGQALAEGEGGDGEGALEHLVPKNGSQLVASRQQQAGGCLPLEGLYESMTLNTQQKVVA